MCHRLKHCLSLNWQRKFKYQINILGPIYCLCALSDLQCFPALTGTLPHDSPLLRLVASQYWDSSARQGLGRSRQALWVCRQALLGWAGMFDLYLLLQQIKKKKCIKCPFLIQHILEQSSIYMWQAPVLSCFSLLCEIHAGVAVWTS